MVNGDNITEERQNILNFDEWTLFEEIHRFLHVLRLRDHVFSWKIYKDVKIIRFSTQIIFKNLFHEYNWHSAMKKYFIGSRSNFW